MIKKGLLLLIALLLPVTIFLFLHFFGQNKFEIPIYHQLTHSEIPSDCPIEYQFPYVVRSGQIPIRGTTVVFFSNGLSADELKESSFQLSRLSNELKKSFSVLNINRVKTKESDQIGEVILMDSLSYETERRCIFLAESNRIVLTDSVRQIRGYYAEASLKEVDRLILECKILFNEY